MYLGENKWRLYENKLGWLKYPIFAILWIVIQLLKCVKVVE